MMIHFNIMSQLKQSYLKIKQLNLHFHVTKVLFILILSLSNLNRSVTVFSNNKIKHQFVYG